jgi:PAS domain S-box-containing protein
MSQRREEFAENTRDGPSWAQASVDLYQRIFEVTSDGVIIHDLTTGLVVAANPAACAMHGYSCEEFIGRPLTTFMDPESQRLFHTSIQTGQSGAGVAVRAVHRRRDGLLFPVEVRWSPFNDQQRPCLLASLRDVSEQVQAEQRLQQQMEARLHEQATLLDISHTLASALVLKPQLILDQLGMLIEYTHAALFTLEGSTLVALAVQGPAALTAALPFRLWLGDSAAVAALLTSPQPTRLPDGQPIDQAAPGLRALLAAQAAVLVEGLQAWMWVPLVVQGRVIGGMSVGHTASDGFTTHHADLALMLANQVAITMVNVQLHEQAQTLAALQERQRLAQDLHDAINQSLFSAGLIAEILPRLWAQDLVAGRQALEDLRLLTRGAQAELRGLLAELRPLVLIDTELGDLLHQLGNALTGRTNIPVSVTVAWQGLLPAAVQVAFYRLCQEALNNIAKHAHASQVEIRLYATAGAIALDICDDGRGFDPAQVPTGHFGLSIMHERATAVGALLSVTSQPCHGTTIALRWTAIPILEDQ